MYVIVSIESGLFFPALAFCREGGQTGEDAGFFCLFLFFKGVGACVNRMTKLFTYDIYPRCDLISSRTDVVRSRALFLDHSLTLSDVADDFLTDLDNKRLC